MVVVVVVVVCYCCSDSVCDFDHIFVVVVDFVCCGC